MTIKNEELKTNELQFAYLMKNEIIKGMNFLVHCLDM